MKMKKMVFAVCAIMLVGTLMMGCGSQNKETTTNESGLTSADEKIVEDIKKDIPKNATKAEVYKNKEGNIEFSYETEDGGGGGGMVLK